MNLRGRYLLDDTLRGGQAFRWRQAEGGWLGTIGPRAALVTAARAGIAVATLPAGRRRDVAAYFRADDDYGAQLARLAADVPLAPAVERYAGLRLLRQEPWEALAAFIVSANNNVARIEGILERLARAAGEPVDAPWGRVWAFPPPRAVAALGVARLRALGCGYRAPLLHETARTVTIPGLRRLRALPREAARARLLDLPGVGPKVADCVLAFALDHTDAFPVDRHVERAVAALYPRAPGAYEKLAAWARARWGDDAALAQQFLFHAERMRRRAPDA